MKRFLNLLSLALVAVVLSNCASVTNLQTAETLDEGAFSHTVAGGWGQVNLDDDDSGLVATAPALDYMLRYGITDVDEIGFRLVNIATYFQGDYKRKLYDAGDFKIASGIGLGGTKVTLSVGTASSSVTFIDVFVPVYFDYWFSQLGAVFVTPKYMLSMTSGDSSTTYSRVGGSLGLRYGKDQGMLAEIGYLKTLSDGDLNLWQFMVGGFF